MKMSILLFVILIILTSVLSKNDCQCEGQIKYYHKGVLIKEITFEKGYYIVGEDCIIERDEKVRYDSIVFRPQLK